MYNNKYDECEECLIRHSLQGVSVSILAGHSPGLSVLLEQWKGRTGLLLSLHSQPQFVG